jgi:hypothetical protein
MDFRSLKKIMEKRLDKLKIIWCVHCDKTCEECEFAGKCPMLEYCNFCRYGYTDSRGKTVCMYAESED